MIFGKKPEPRGEGDREGERGKEAASGENRMRRTFWKAFGGSRGPNRVGKPSGIPPARAGEMVSLAGFGRLE